MPYDQHHFHPGCKNKMHMERRGPHCWCFEFFFLTGNLNHKQVVVVIFLLFRVFIVSMLGIQNIISLNLVHGQICILWRTWHAANNLVKRNFGWFSGTSGTLEGALGKHYDNYYNYPLCHWEKYRLSTNEKHFQTIS